MKRLTLVALVALVALAAAGCRTIGLGIKGVAEVSPAVAANMILDSQQVVVLDVRSAADYRGPEGHISGSLNAPFETIEQQLPELLPYQNQTILVYGQSSTDGEVVAKLLITSGFRNVVHIAGGLENWIRHGYGTVNSQE